MHYMAGVDPIPASLRRVAAAQVEAEAKSQNATHCKLGHCFCCEFDQSLNMQQTWDP